MSNYRKKKLFTQTTDGRTARQTDGRTDVAYDKHIGYEPAGPTMHPPPQNDRGWVHFFRIGI